MYNKFSTFRSRMLPTRYMPEADRFLVLSLLLLLLWFAAVALPTTPPFDVANMDEPTLQVAANTRGVALLQGLVSEYGLDVISAYMGHIQVQ